ncbi:DUF4851 domain-containing protein, partial [Desulfovibrio sp. OttesenSCG-928-F20]|nr:DUF4851 domain-containing protein [Desulfovibrio sp. OttesenSCG-928-F20]
MRRIILCFIPLLALCACSARLEKASERDFSTPGRGAFHIKVNEPLTLGAEGKYRFFVPSDVLTRPGASFGYAVYAEPGVGRVDKQIHCIASRLERGAWRWEKETWARREAVSYSILSAGGRNWTVQMLPVDGEKDWFSALWAQKGRETPPFWLAKRWSATPDDDIRLVVEYREAAPQCLQERLLV